MCVTTEWCELTIFSTKLVFPFMFSQLWLPSSNLPSFHIQICPLSSFICTLIQLNWCITMQLQEKAMATHSSTLAWKTPWTEEPGSLQSMGSNRVGHNWSDLAAATGTYHTFKIQQLTSLSYSQPPNLPSQCGQNNLKFNIPLPYKKKSSMIL